MTGVRAVVLRSGMVLLVRKGDAWGFVGGPAAPGETPADAAVRLVKERLRVDGAAGAEAARAGGLVAVLVPRFSGEIALPRGDYAWVEARSLLERDLDPADRPLA